MLFVDLVGFTARSDLADPEDVRAALRPFHAAAKREIERHGGTVEKFIGDAVMAVFGAPFAHEDDSERAVRAALAIRGRVEEQGAGLQVRMAVNTGVALVSLDTRPEAGEPIAAGDVVNTAQRLQAAAPVNGILVGEQTYRATREAIEYREAAPVEAKGKAEPVPVWEAVEARSRFGVDLVREPRTPLAGRRRELDLVLSALSRAREERSPELVTLVGVPGIGKSRLVFELFKAVAEEPALVSWRQGRCLPYGEGVSFWALGEAVKAQAGILESDTSEETGRKLHEAVTAVLPDAGEAEWVEQQLQPLVGVGGEIGMGERAGEASAAWRRFLEALADQRPLVLVVEDLHWADEGLLDFVDEVADRVRDAPLLLLCTARPELLERRPGWGGGKANALTISLPPLSDEETEQVAAAALDRAELATEVRDELLARAAGNPLYAEQFARVLAELGRLDELPETVHGVIAARLDGLSEEEKTLLQDAAVVGKVFWLGALEAIGPTARRQAEDVLYGLERKEFVQRARRSSVEGAAEYAFKHVLLRDVAYGQIPRAARGEKHRRAAAWIESFGRPEDHAEMLAHHYLSAIEYTRAAGREDVALAERSRVALKAAGDRALALASYAAAARFYGATLDVWPESDPDRVWLLVHAGRARNAADGTGIDLLRQGFEELLSRGDRGGAVEVAVDLARSLWFGGDRDSAYAYMDRALELAKSGTNSRAKVHALVARASYHMIASEHPEAICLAREALPLAEAMQMHELHVRALDVLGSARAYSGDVAGLDDSKRAIALARETKAFYYLLTAEGNLCMTQIFLARLEAASETLRSWRDDMESYGTAALKKWLRGYEAFESVVQGQWDEAVDILDPLIDAVEAGAPQYLEPSWRGLRSSIELARGNLEAASTGSALALERAWTTKDPQILAPALAFRGIVLLALGEREKASSLASEALALGSLPLGGLLELIPVATPIEFAWLLRDLGRETELLPAIEAAPSTLWYEAAKAVARGDFARAIELVVEIGAPSVEAYTRLRAAETVAESEAEMILAPALDFFRGVGATRYLEQAEALLARSA